PNSCYRQRRLCLLLPLPIRTSLPVLIIALNLSNPLTINPASDLLPRGVRLHHHLQKQPLRPKVPPPRRPRLLPLCQTRPPPLRKALRPGRPLPRKGRLPRRPGSLPRRPHFPHCPRG